MNMALTDATLNDPNMGLVKYEEMTRAIAECLEAITAIDMHKQARALETMAHLANNREAEQRAAEIRIRAERKAGQLLKDSQRATGNQHTSVAESTDTTERPPTLDELSISKDQSSKWQQLADVPEKAFDKYLSQPGVPSTSGALVCVLSQGTVQKQSAKDSQRPRRAEPTADEIDLRKLHKAAAETFDDLFHPGVPLVERFGDKLLEGKLPEMWKICSDTQADLDKMRGVSDIGIPLKIGPQYHPTVTDIEVWQSAFPTLNIEEQLRQIAVWNDANPGKRKTQAGIKSHIFSWLSNVGRRSAFGSGEGDVDENAGRHKAL